MFFEVIFELEVVIVEVFKNCLEFDCYVCCIFEVEQEVACVKGQGGFQVDLIVFVGWICLVQDLEQIYQLFLNEQLLQVQVSVFLLDWGVQCSCVVLQQACFEFEQWQV